MLPVLLTPFAALSIAPPACLYGSQPFPSCMRHRGGA